MDIEYRVPVLPWEPRRVVAQLRLELQATAARQVALIGSSMGGFYASCLAEQFDLPAVLINPVVHPHELLGHHLGENRNLHTNETYELGAEHVAQLEAMEQPLEQPGRFWVLVQTGDETLDCRLALARYRRSRCSIEPGGSHGFDHFEQHMRGILAFLKMPLPED